jgi:hypothetical protein
MQPDGNLVLYSGSWAMWASNTYGNSVAGVVMQTDGNLVIYRSNGSALWASNTYGNPNSSLVMQNDCNAVIYKPGGIPIWATNTLDCTFGITGTPFGGWWDRFGLSHPSSHHRVECEPAFGTHATKPVCNADWGPGDWSIDYYGPDRPVVFGVPSSAGSWSARVWAIAPTCSGAGGGSIAGWTVFVDIYVNGGWQGWESFGHLNNVQVTPGQWIGSGTVLGYTKKWEWHLCYRVNNPDGVHIHHEEWNFSSYACWWPYSSGSYLNYNQWFGTVGRIGYTGVQQQC